MTVKEGTTGGLIKFIDRPDGVRKVEFLPDGYSYSIIIDIADIDYEEVKAQDQEGNVHVGPLCEGIELSSENEDDIQSAQLAAETDINLQEYLKDNIILKEGLLEVLEQMGATDETTLQDVISYAVNHNIVEIDDEI